MFEIARSDSLGLTTYLVTTDDGEILGEFFGEFAEFNARFFALCLTKGEAK